MSDLRVPTFYASAPFLVRVLHVIPSVSPKDGGPSYAISAYARALTRAGIDVTIATTDDDGGRQDLRVAPGQSVELNGVPHFFFRRNTEFYKISLGMAKWLDLNMEHFDLIHLHALFSFSSSVGARIARRRRKPYVVRPLGVLNRWGLQNRRRFIKNLSLRRVELPLLKAAAALHFTAQAEADEAMSLSDDLQSVRRAVIPVPVETEAAGDSVLFHRSFPIANGRELILSLSRLEPKKGIELLLASFAAARDVNPRLLLTIAGEGPAEYVEALKTKAGELRLAQDVLWTGHLIGEVKAAAFAAASVFVLTSHSENFGVAPVEALAAGLPIVISREVAISSAVAAASAGRVVSRDPIQTADAILKTLDERDVTIQQVANGRGLVQEKYSPDPVGTQLAQLYRSILSS